jgi:hypothetical protein
MTNNKTALITRPNDDAILNFLYFWSDPIITATRKHNLLLLDLKGSKSNRKELESYIKKNNPSLVLFNGHGDEVSIRGYNNELLIEYGKNHELLDNRIIYARSCNSGKVLGQKCNAKAFIGYVNKFVFYYDATNNTHPLKDLIAARFLIPSNLIATTLLKGNPAKEAHSRSLNLMVKNYFEMVSSNGTFEERHIASFLWGNIAGQKLYGDPDAHI